MLTNLEKEMLPNSETNDNHKFASANLEESKQQVHSKITTNDLPKNSRRTGNYFLCCVKEFLFSTLLILRLLHYLDLE